MSEALCSAVAALMAEMGSGLAESWLSSFWATKVVSFGHKPDRIASSCEVDVRCSPEDEKKDVYYFGKYVCYSSIIHNVEKLYYI